MFSIIINLLKFNLDHHQLKKKKHNNTNYVFIICLSMREYINIYNNTIIIKITSVYLKQYNNYIKSIQQHK